MQDEIKNLHATKLKKEQETQSRRKEHFDRRRLESRSKHGYSIENSVDFMFNEKYNDTDSRNDFYID